MMWIATLGMGNSWSQAFFFALGRSSVEDRSGGLMTVMDLTVLVPAGDRFGIWGRDTGLRCT